MKTKFNAHKFNLGDWIISEEVHHDYRICQIIGVDDDKYFIESIEGYTGFNYFNTFDNLYHLWTIQDAKDGDVLAEHETIVLFKKIEGLNIKCYCTYHYLGYNLTFYVDTLQNKTPYRPTTKKQRDRLFQKMKETGYEWDAEKKELKKIVQNPAWSEEDESKFKFLHHLLEQNVEPHGSYSFPDVKELGYVTKQKALDMLKSLKSRVQPRQEWSEEDEKEFEQLLRILHANGYESFDIWLKSLKERYTWKPSEEQIKALEHVLLSYIGSWQPELQSLLNDLMKLKEL